MGGSKAGGQEALRRGHPADPSALPNCTILSVLSDPYTSLNSTLHLAHYKSFLTSSTDFFLFLQSNKSRQLQHT